MGLCGSCNVSSSVATSKGEKCNDMESVQAKRQEELHTDLKKMVNRPESSDMAFKCSDGIRVHACRLLLASRCAVLERMLTNGMLESNVSEISMPRFASPAILAIVEYLYTGAIESYRPLGWKTGLEIISAAQFFIIPAVKEIAHDFLRDQFNETMQNQAQKPLLMEMLSTALEFEEEWDGKDKILRDLVSSIGPNWFDEDCCHKLSRQAVECIVSNLERESHKGESSFMDEEYFTLRNLVLWHVYQGMGPGAESANITTVLHDILPGGDPSSLWWKISKIPAAVDSIQLNTSTTVDLAVDQCTPSVIMNSLLGAEAYKDSFVPLLKHIDLKLIPPPLMMKIIVPLNIIPAENLIKALLCIAVNSYRREPTRFKWRAGSSLAIGSDGQISCTGTSRSAHGMGVALILSPSSSGVYEWAFQILEKDTDFIELGLVCDPPGQNGIGDEKLEVFIAQALPLSRILCIYTAGTGAYVSRQHPISPGTWTGWERFDIEVKVNSIVKFQLNLQEKTCQVRIGNSFQAVWEGLPDNNYHPAVGFISCKRARIQLTIAGDCESCLSKE